MHELASTFPREDFRLVFEASRFVIFPARYVLEEAHRVHATPLEKSLVLPQGLLDPAFGEGDPREAREALLKEIGAVDDAFLVLGCGTLDLRKGVDVFTRAATAAVRLSPPEIADRPLYFIWIGGGPTHAHSPLWYAEQDITRAGLSDRVVFLGVRSEPQRYFLGCDAFALTSRMDRFPCVVHEAMACGKPIVAFANSGGAPEALADGAGIVVGYGDADAMARALRKLADDPELATAIGERARRRVHEVYRFPDYVAKILETVRDRIGVVFEPRPIAPQRGRVIFTLEDAAPDPRSTFVMRLARGLGSRGFRSEIVFTSRDARATEALPPPRAPCRWLNWDSGGRAPFLERARRLVDALRAAAPAVLIPGGDLLGSAIAPIAPRKVGSLGLVLDAQPRTWEQAVRLGRYWQRVVAAPRVASALQRVVPEMASRVETIVMGAPEAPARSPLASGPLQTACAWNVPSVEGWGDFTRQFADNSGAAAPAYVLVIPCLPSQCRGLESALAEAIGRGSVRLVAAAHFDDFVATLVTCDVLLVSSDAPMPVEIAEAMRLGLVPLCVARGAAERPPPELRDGLNGYRIAAAEPERARALLNELARAPVRLSAMRSAAQTSGAEALGDWDSVVDRYAEILVEMLEELRAGDHRRPDAPHVHPSFGGLSFPPPPGLDPDADFAQASPSLKETAPAWTHFGWKAALSVAASDADGAAETAGSGIEIPVAAPDGRLMLQVEANASESAVLSIRTRTEIEDLFDPATAVTAQLRPGRNEIKVYLHRAAPVEAIRVEFEGPGGAATLRSARLFAPASVRASPWPKLPPGRPCRLHARRQWRQLSRGSLVSR